MKAAATRRSEREEGGKPVLVEPEGLFQFRYQSPADKTLSLSLHSACLEPEPLNCATGVFVIVVKLIMMIYDNALLMLSCLPVVQAKRGGMPSVSKSMLLLLLL